MTACALLIVVVYPSFLMASSGGFAASIIGVMLLAVGSAVRVVTAALLGNLPDPHPIYRVGHYLQHGLHPQGQHRWWRHG